MPDSEDDVSSFTIFHYRFNCSGGMMGLTESGGIVCRIAATSANRSLVAASQVEGDMTHLGLPLPLLCQPGI